MKKNVCIFSLVIAFLTAGCTKNTTEMTPVEYEAPTGSSSLMSNEDDYDDYSYQSGDYYNDDELTSEDDGEYDEYQQACELGDYVYNELIDLNNKYIRRFRNAYDLWDLEREFNRWGDEIADLYQYSDAIFSDYQQYDLENSFHKLGEALGTRYAELGGDVDVLESTLRNYFDQF